MREVYFWAVYLIGVVTMFCGVILNNNSYFGFGILAGLFFLMLLETMGEDLK